MRLAGVVEPTPGKDRGRDKLKKKETRNKIKLNRRTNKWRCFDVPPSYNSSKSSSKDSHNQPGSTNELEQVLFGCPLTDGRAGYGGVEIAPSTPPNPAPPTFTQITMSMV